MTLKKMLHKKKMLKSKFKKKIKKKTNMKKEMESNNNNNKMTKIMASSPRKALPTCNLFCVLNSIRNTAN